MIKTYISEGNTTPMYKVIPNIVYSQLLGDPTVNAEAVIPGNIRKAPLTLTLMYAKPLQTLEEPDKEGVPGEGDHKPGPAAGPDAGPRKPVIINVEGGGFNIFQKDQNLVTLRYLCDAGFTVACVDYRKASESHWPSAIRDIKCAIRFLRTYADDFNIEPDRIGIIGESAGGYLAAFVGATSETREFDSGAYLDQSSAVQAACDMYGPTDFLKMDDDPNHSFFRDHCDPLSPESQFLGAGLKEIPEIVARANPMTYVSKNTPPMLILHGDKDGNVGYSQSVMLHDALVAAGNEKVEMWRVPDHGHGGPAFTEPKMFNLINDFFTRAFNDVK